MGGGNTVTFCSISVLPKLFSSNIYIHVLYVINNLKTKAIFPWVKMESTYLNSKVTVNTKYKMETNHQFPGAVKKKKKVS